MESIGAQWFVCKVRYDKQMEDGMQKKVTESYVIDSLSFTEAEERITEEMQNYILGEFEVRDITLAPYSTIFFKDSLANYWYKVKVQFISLDEKTLKEKRSSSLYLVNAESLKDAVASISDSFGKSMIDYVISSVSETNIIEVFKYKKG